jgi:DNA-binding transcriptional regulator YdaS (Cro superfamily)
MNLEEYFYDKPRGAKTKMAKELDISNYWMSCIILRKKTPSPYLAIQIHELTKGKVHKKTLRPDIFDKQGD